jgi:hypothetical protein
MIARKAYYVNSIFNSNTFRTRCGKEFERGKAQKEEKKGVAAVRTDVDAERRVLVAILSIGRASFRARRNQICAAPRVLRALYTMHPALTRWAKQCRASGANLREARHLYFSQRRTREILWPSGIKREKEPFGSRQLTSTDFSLCSFAVLCS